MSLVHIKITDSAIASHAALPVKRLRDSLNPLIQFRFSNNRAKGYWFVYYRSWKRVGEWPQSKTRDVRNGFGALLAKLQSDQEAKVTKDCFVTVGDLLNWYGERMEENTSLSVQRKKDIKSSVKCHLKLRLDKVEIADIDKNLIENFHIYSDVGIQEGFYGYYHDGNSFNIKGK